MIQIQLLDVTNQREFLAHAAIEATQHLGVKGIITDSETGQTARALASFRGPTPVLAICYKEKDSTFIKFELWSYSCLSKRTCFFTAYFHCCAQNVNTKALLRA